MKKQQEIIILASILCLLFLGCEAMAELFHGPKPEITYTVTFNPNGATAGTPPATKIVTVGTVINLPDENDLSKGTDIFAGWSETASGGTIYPVSASVTVAENMNFYAQWLDGDTPQYTVEFDSNGATGGLPPTSQTIYRGMPITIPNQGTLVYSGKTFGGWNTLPNGGGTNYTAGTIYTVTAPIKLYAKWQSAIQYTVTYNANGGGTAPQAQTVDPQTVITLPGQGSMANTGKTFDGWNTQANGEGISYAAETAYTVTGNITLYAKWQIKIEYTVTYYANGASGTAPAAQTVDPGTIITLPGEENMTYSGRPFLGWNTQANGEGTDYTAGTEYTVTGNVQLYAKWYSPTYTVVYDANGGSGAMPNSIFFIGTSQNLQANAFTNIGYRFNGWAISADGEVMYTNLQSVNSLTSVDGATVTLYAVWEESVTMVPGMTLNDKFIWLDTNAESDNTYILEVNFSEGLGPRTLSYSGKTGITLRLKGGSAMRILTLSNRGTLFTVESGVTLMLDGNITLKGIDNNNSQLVRINSGGTFIMNTETIIAGNKGVGEVTATCGVSVNGGIFTMNGGEITDNITSLSNRTTYGGGVSVSSGTFTMNEGKISGNTVSAYNYTAYGGGVSVSGGTFTMNGGEISGNTVSASDLSAYGGGVSVSGGTFTMHDGKITGNTTSNTNSYGIGVSVSGGTFTMNGGEISGNTASSAYSVYRTYGGGVSVSGGTFTLNDGMITGNTALNSGGGVYVSSGNFTKTGGTILGFSSGNSDSNVVKNRSGAVQNNQGHAVYAARGATIKRWESDAGSEVFMMFDGTTTNPTWIGDWEF